MNGNENKSHKSSQEVFQKMQRNVMLLPKKSEDVMPKPNQQIKSDDNYPSFKEHEYSQIPSLTVDHHHYESLPSLIPPGPSHPAERKLDVSNVEADRNLISKRFHSLSLPVLDYDDFPGESEI